MRVPRSRHAALVAIFAVVGWSRAAAAATTINPGGGSGPSDGLRIVVQPTGAYQIVRGGVSQLAKPEGPNLAVGSAVSGGNVPGATAWIQVAQSAVTGAGTAASPWQVVTVVANPAGFTLTETVRYVLAEDAIDIRIVVAPPASNGSIVKLYHLTDAFVGGADNGAAYWQPAGAPPLAIPTVIGVTRAGLHEVFIAGDVPWTAYYAAYFATAYAQIAGGGDLGNNLDTNVNTDGGAGVQWTLGAITAPVTIAYRQAFTPTAPRALCGDGAIVGFEACDDGGVGGGDGCSACAVEIGLGVRGRAERVRAASCGDGVSPVARPATMATVRTAMAARAARSRWAGRAPARRDASVRAGAAAMA